jgi:hypothetical protein
MVFQGGEEVVSVLFLLLMATGLLTVCVAAVWPRSDGSPGAAGTPGRSRTARPPTTGTPAPAPTPETLEGVLVAQVTVGQVRPRQYLILHVSPGRYMRPTPPRGPRGRAHRP